MLLSTKVKRFSVSCIQDFFFLHNLNFLTFLGELLVLKPFSFAQLVLSYSLNVYHSFISFSVCSLFDLLTLL